MRYKFNYILNKILLLLFLSVYSIQSGVAQDLVSMSTNKGEIVVLLYDDTPIHKANFMKLIKANFYDSLLFHRVIKDFMIQSGDPLTRPPRKANKFGSGGPGYTLEAELNTDHIHKKGALAAARQGDDINPSRRSSGSQFYIVQGRKTPRKYMDRFVESRGKAYTEKELDTYENVGGTPHLDGQYTVFGEVLFGMDVLDTIANSPTKPGDVPVEEIYIINMKIKK